MGVSNPIDLLFGNMEKLGPGSSSDTLKVLDMVPRPAHGVIVDAGCGAGRQTLALANHLQMLVHAVDSYESFGRLPTTRQGFRNQTPNPDTLYGHGRHSGYV